MSHPQGWEIPVLKTQAFQNVGLQELAETLEAHRVYLSGSEQLQDKLLALREVELEEALEEAYRRQLKGWISQLPEAEKFRQEVLSGRISAYEGASRIFPLLQGPKR